MTDARVKLLESQSKRLLEALEFFKRGKNDNKIVELLGYIEKGEFKEVR